MPRTERRIDPAMQEVWLDVAEKFGERESLPCFAGRNRILTDALRSAARPPASERTWVFEGASGTGKTALLSEIERRHKGTPGHDVVSLTAPQSEATVQSMLVELAKKLDPEWTPPTSITRTDSATGRISAIFARMGLSTSQASTVGHHALARNFVDLRSQHLARLNARPHLARRRVILLLDEAQALGQPASEPLLALHNDREIPIVMLLAGLPNLVDRLGELGLSRLTQANHRAVGCLDDDETREAIEHNLRAGFEMAGLPGFKLYPGVVERLAHPTDGWPQHIAIALRSMWEVMARDGATGITPERLDDACAKAEKGRHAYYETRLRRAGMDPRLIHAAIEATGTTGCSKSTVQDAIDETLRHLPEGARRRHLRTYSGSEGLGVDTLRRTGFLVALPDTQTVLRATPIPSLRSYTRGKALQIRTEQQRRARRDDTAQGLRS